MNLMNSKAKSGFLDFCKIAKPPAVPKTARGLFGKEGNATTPILSLFSGDMKSY